DRTGDGAAPDLFLVGGRVAEPGIEPMIVLAAQRIADHAGLSSRSGGASSTSIATVKGRALASAGTRWRASVTAAGSSSATSTPGSSPSIRATIPPHGSTIIECP